MVDKERNMMEVNRKTSNLVSKPVPNGESIIINNNMMTMMMMMIMMMIFKVPLTPKYFLNRNKTLFGVDYFGEKISAIGLFLDFL